MSSVHYFSLKFPLNFFSFFDWVVVVGLPDDEAETENGSALALSDGAIYPNDLFVFIKLLDGPKVLLKGWNPWNFPRILVFKVDVGHRHSTLCPSDPLHLWIDWNPFEIVGVLTFAEELRRSLAIGVKHLNASHTALVDWFIHLETCYLDWFVDRHKQQVFFSLRPLKVDIVFGISEKRKFAHGLANNFQGFFLPFINLFENCFMYPYFRFMRSYRVWVPCDVFV